MGEAASLDGFCGSDQDRLDLVTSAGHDYLKGRFLLEAPADGLLIRLQDMLEPERLHAAIDHCAEKFPGVDRRAVVSVWSLYYLSLVGIGVMVAAVVYRVKLPLAVDGLTLLSDEEGYARALVLPHLGEREEGAIGPAMLEDLLRSHCAPVIEAVARAEKVSKRMLWNNLIVYVAWVLRDIGEHIGEEAVRETQALLEAKAFADGAANPLFGLLRTDAATGEPVRKVCCLRYCVAGVGGCGNLCPLPEGRASAEAIAAE